RLLDDADPGMSIDHVDVFWHADVLTHETGSGVFDDLAQDWLEVPETHPENAERIQNLHGILRRGPLADRMRWHEGRHVTLEGAARLHDRPYLEDVRAACERGRRFTRTTLVSPGSWAGIAAAAGTALAAADAVLDGTSRCAYALVRPP